MLQESILNSLLSGAYVVNIDVFLSLLEIPQVDMYLCFSVTPQSAPRHPLAP